MEKLSEVIVGLQKEVKEHYGYIQTMEAHIIKLSRDSNAYRETCERLWNHWQETTKKLELTIEQAKEARARENIRQSGGLPKARPYVPPECAQPAASSSFKECA